MPKLTDAEQAAANKAAADEAAAVDAAKKAADENAAADKAAKKAAAPDKRETFGKVKVLSESKTARVLQDDRFVWKETK